MKLKARILAVVMAVVMLFCLAGCSTDITYITEYEDIKVYTGLYTCALLRAMNTALNYIPSDTTDAWSEKIDGVSAEQWVLDRAHETVRQYVALQLLAKEMGIELTDDEKQTAESMQSIMFSYYSYYEANNVSEAAMRQFCEMQLLYQDVFQAIYGEGGEKEIPEQDVLAYYEENYIEFRMLTFENYDADGNYYTGTDLTDFENLRDQYVEMAQADPSKMDELISRYKAYRNDIYLGTDTSDPFPTSAEEVEVSDQLQTINIQDQSSYPTEALEQIRALAVDTPTLLSYEQIEFLVSRQELTPYEDVKDSLDETIRLYLKEAEFSDMLNESGNGLGLKFNGAATREYAPKTLSIS